MANMADMARMLAAQGGSEGMGMTGGPEENPELMPPPEDEMAEATSDPMSDLMGAIDTIEATIPQLPESVAQKVRQQVEAFRALVEEVGTELNQEEAPKMSEAAPAAPGAPAEGAMAEDDLSGV